VAQQRKWEKRPPNQHPRDNDIPTSFFPRAEFGMPIIIEIREEGVSDGRKVPLKPTIQYSKDVDRLASPVILRPIKFTNDKIGAMVAVLNTKPLESAYLKKGKFDLIKEVDLKPENLRDSKLLTYDDSPYQTACSTSSDNPNGSAVKAFLAYAKTKFQFKGITP